MMHSQLDQLLELPLSIARHSSGKLRILFLLNLLNVSWLGYYFYTQFEVSVLWFSPLFLVLFGLIVHQFSLFMAFRSLIRLPGKLSTLAEDARDKVTVFYNDHVDSEGNRVMNSHSVYRAYNDMQGVAEDIQAVMSPVMRTMLLGNPLVLGASLLITVCMSAISLVAFLAFIF